MAGQLTVTGQAGVYKVKKIKHTSSDLVFYIVVYSIMTISMLIVLYPLIYILSASFSSPQAIISGKVVLWPVDISLKGYKAVFESDQIIIGYRNTFFYTFAGTFINVVMTILAAYPLARKDLPYKGILMFIFTFTTIFTGGLIPSYILMKNLNIINTVWVMLLPGAISVYNVIIARTFIQGNIPADMLEAAQIDGCSDFKYLTSIVLPLSKAVIAVITLYYAVGHWNAFFNAFIYLSNKNLYPLQLILRDILVLNSIDNSMLNDPELAEAKQGLADLLKYSLIVVSTAPILCMYPFAQKYFVRGVMIGSLKG